MEEFKMFAPKLGEEVTIRILDVRYFVHKIKPIGTQHSAGTLPGCPLCEAGYPVVKR